MEQCAQMIFKSLPLCDSMIFFVVDCTLFTSLLSALWEALVFSADGDDSKDNWSVVDPFFGSLRQPQRFFRSCISYSISIMENAFLRHDNEYVLQLDLKNNSCKSPYFLSPSVSF